MENKIEPNQFFYYNNYKFGNCLCFCISSKMFPAFENEGVYIEYYAYNFTIKDCGFYNTKYDEIISIESGTILKVKQP